MPWTAPPIHTSSTNRGGLEGLSRSLRFSNPEKRIDLVYRRMNSITQHGTKKGIARAAAVAHKQGLKQIPSLTTSKLPTD